MQRRTILRGIALSSAATLGVGTATAARSASLDEFDVLHVQRGDELLARIENPTRADLADVGTDDCVLVKCYEDCPPDQCCGWGCRCYGDDECGPD